MAKRYIVTLTDEERTRLDRLTRSGSASARMIRRARTLLLADAGRIDADISAALGIGVSTVERTRRRFVDEGMEAAVVERQRPGAEPKLDPKAQATVIALACTTAPEGRSRWTMQLLADRAVELRLAPDISPEAIRRLLKKPVQALAEEDVVHPGGGCRVPVPDGRRARHVCSHVRPGGAGGLSG